ncbi:MAG: ester cyclase [Lepagella sp.]
MKAYIAFVIIVACALFCGIPFTSCSNTSSQKESSADSSISETLTSSSSQEEAKNIVKAFFHEGYVTHNYDSVMLLMADDYFDHSPAAARSNADAVGILKIVEGQFSDMKITFLDLFADGDMVATRIRFEGIHADTIQGIPATGKHISFEALENFKVVDGKITESWGYWPDNEIHRQLTAN